MIELMSIDIVYAVVAGILIQAVIQFLLSKSSKSQELIRLKREVSSLQDKVTLLESSHQDAPIPIWLKDRSGIMLALNPSYEKEFLIPLGKNRKDYLHKSDYDIWPEEIAREYVQNDNFVMRTRSTWIGYENILDHKGDKVKWKIIKYPRTAGGVIIGIAGMAIPPD